ncbi:MAG TPA: biotin/lipoyl-containing protein, partial [Aggregatilineales bacterium]|nr:biotin/lipoyl-containing protein [Aggregatilineales bacterium]
MPVEIIVPDLGESVTEATVARWLKQEGDAVAVGEPVVELETDKVNLEVGADKPGTLSSIRVQAGEDVQVGDVLGTLDERAAGAQPPAPPQQAPQESAPAPAAQPARPGDGSQRATPVAQRMADEHGIDINRVETRGGRVTKDDVQRYLNRQRQPAPEPQPVARPARPGETRERMSRRRRTIARRL